MTSDARAHLQAALDAARTGEAEGGIPIGSALFLDGELVASGYNRRVQDGSAIHHAETNCLENAGRLTSAEYARATLVTTLSPCAMCTGAALLYKIPRIVIGENQTFLGEEELLRSRGVELTVLDDAECVEMMTRFITTHPTLWAEDIGELPPA
jgi:cytosine/creatinine deaminase